MFTIKTLIFSKTVEQMLNSHKNALNQCKTLKNCNKTKPCKTLNCNETKQFFQWITASFSEKTYYLQSH